MPFEAGVNGKPSSGNLSDLLIFYWFDQDTTTIVVIDDQYNILVASGGDVLIGDFLFLVEIAFGGGDGLRQVGLLDEIDSWPGLEKSLFDGFKEG